jgi:hypothetical protein
MLKLALPLLAGCLAAVSFAASAQSNSDITVTVNAASGDYTVESKALHWTFGGSIGQPLQNVHHKQGKDAAGTYQSVSFTWKNGMNYGGTIRWYADKPVVIFSLSFPDGAHQAPVAFPDFTQIPSGLYHFSYRDINFAPPEFKLGETSTPWLLFDANKKACVISPASDFIVSKLTGDGNSQISSGLNSELQQLPAHFTHSTIMVLDNGIRTAWDDWGNALRAIYHRNRPANDADPVLKYFGYWTDNGADYYYNYDTTLGYAGTLLAVRKQYEKEGIPMGYMQLDSWWYEKSIIDPDGRPDADHKNPELPSGPWNRYGGLMEYRADPFLFPNGLKAFQQKLGLPLVTHNRWVDPTSPYRKMYKISGFAAVDPAYWKEIMGYIKSAGVVCYEQDWLNFIYNKSPQMASTLSVGNAFTDGMAHAAKAAGIDLQYCMAMPRFFMQGLKYDNLTTIRTSDDRFEPRKWMSFIFTSQLAYEMGIWPWCDVFKSPETGNMIVSVLSAGAVGTGDALGKEDKANIMMACRNDGVLVKPDLPLLPMDEDYIQMAKRENKPILAYTYTQHGDIRTGYVFAFADKETTDYQVDFKPEDVGEQGEVVIYTPQDNHLKIMNAGESFHDELAADKYAYYIIAPVTSSGIAFLGDEGKIAATGKKRIATIKDMGKTLQVKVLFAKGEKDVMLHGYCKRPVTADKGSIAQDAATHLFTLTLPANGNEVTVNLMVK